MPTIHCLRGSVPLGTATLIEAAQQKTLASPGSVLWLAPSIRALNEQRTALLASQPILLELHAVTLGDWIEQVIAALDPTCRPLSNAQQRLLLEEVVEEVHGDAALRHFRPVLETRGFSAGLRDLIAELKRLGIGPIAFTQAVSATKGHECARLYARYEQRLERLRVVDVPGRPLHAARLLRERGLPGSFSRVRSVFLAGFTDFTPAQFDVLTALAPHVAEIWLALADEDGDERGELFATSRATAERVAVLQLAAGLPAVFDEEPPASRRLNEERPALRHLDAHLFRSLRTLTPSADAAGLAVIEAPGRLGEVRLVLRAVKERLDAGIPAGAVLLVVRDLDDYADLLAEVAAEYAIPLDIEGIEPLPRVGSIAALLRALRLPLDDWPFAGVTALLRSGYLDPHLPEVLGDPEVIAWSEVLLRLLGEPRDRAAYLRAVERWETEPPAGLEDEAAEESRRRKTHELARRCGPFLRRFFALWDGFPTTRRLGEHLDWLAVFLRRLGLDRTGSRDLRDRLALQRLNEELARWRERTEAGRRDAPFDATTFLRRLTALVGELGLARTPRGPGRVRLLSADLARALHAEHVFVLGLGEGSFPQATATPFFDETDRQTFRAAGLPFPLVSEQLPAEMLLFHQVVTSATQTLTLSYPAVDERGQELLPSSFLQAVQACFTPGAIPTTRRRMLLEAIDQDVPASLAELRVRLAQRAGGALTSDPALADLLPADARVSLQDAAQLAYHRFHVADHTTHEGLLTHPAVLAKVAERFGPGRIYSPTALEDYVACPFKFFAKHVLRLDPLESPQEEIEVTRRGQAFHRALARLHRRLKDEDVHGPGERSHEYLSTEMAEAVREDIARAPSAAARELWRLEGERLQRQAGRYATHWSQFLAPWLEKAIEPRPSLFEVDFGLPPAEGAEPQPELHIAVGGLEVRISGRIDRVDEATLPDGAVGFWIIDYKTGRAAHYTGSDLETFSRLQLTLYALAVQEVLLRDRSARPLGLVYWLVSESGPKVVLPTSRNKTLWLNETDGWRKLRATLEGWVAQLGESIRTGYFALAPRSRTCTQTCPYGRMCRISQARAVGKPNRLALPVVA